MVLNFYSQRISSAYISLVHIKKNAWDGVVTIAFTTQASILEPSVVKVSGRPMLPQMGVFGTYRADSQERASAGK